MPIEITELKGTERSTMVFACTFKDEDENEVSPVTMGYTLTDTAGTVVNEIEDVAIDTPAAIENIVLSGNDLQILSGETDVQAGRILTLSGTYDSTYGNGLYLTESIHFAISNLVKIS